MRLTFAKPATREYRSSMMRRMIALTLACLLSCGDISWAISGFSAPARSSLAPQLRLGPFFRANDLHSGFENEFTVYYAAAALRDMLSRKEFRSARIAFINQLFSGGEIAIEKPEGLAGFIGKLKLPSGGQCKYTVLNFKKEQKTVEIRFTRDPVSPGDWNVLPGVWFAPAKQNPVHLKYDSFKDALSALRSGAIDFSLTTDDMRRKFLNMLSLSPEILKKHGPGAGNLITGDMSVKIGAFGGRDLSRLLDLYSDHVKYGNKRAYKKMMSELGITIAGPEPYARYEELMADLRNGGADWSRVPVSGPVCLKLLQDLALCLYDAGDKDTSDPGYLISYDFGNKYDTFGGRRLTGFIRYVSAKNGSTCPEAVKYLKAKNGIEDKVASPVEWEDSCSDWGVVYDIIKEHLGRRADTPEGAVALLRSLRIPTKARNDLNTALARHATAGTGNNPAAVKAMEAANEKIVFDFCKNNRSALKNDADDFAQIAFMVVRRCAMRYRADSVPATTFAHYVNVALKHQLGKYLKNIRRQTLGAVNGEVFEIAARSGRTKQTSQERRRHKTPAARRREKPGSDIAGVIIDHVLSKAQDAGLDEDQCGEVLKRLLREKYREYGLYDRGINKEIIERNINIYLQRAGDHGISYKELAARNGANNRQTVYDAIDRCDRFLIDYVMPGFYNKSSRDDFILAASSINASRPDNGMLEPLDKPINDAITDVTRGGAWKKIAAFWRDDSGGIELSFSRLKQRPAKEPYRDFDEALAALKDGRIDFSRTDTDIRREFLNRLSASAEMQARYGAGAGVAALDYRDMRSKIGSFGGRDLSRLLIFYRRNRSDGLQKIFKDMIGELDLSGGKPLPYQTYEEFLDNINAGTVRWERMPQSGEVCRKILYELAGGLKDDSRFTARAILPDTGAANPGYLAVVDFRRGIKAFGGRGLYGFLPAVAKSSGVSEKEALELMKEACGIPDLLHNSPQWESGPEDWTAVCGVIKDVLGIDVDGRSGALKALREERDKNKEEYRSFKALNRRFAVYATAGTGNNPAAVEAMVVLNAKLTRVAEITARVNNDTGLRDHLKSEIALILTRCARKYDPAQPAEFSTYAVSAIEHELINYKCRRCKEAAMFHTGERFEIASATLEARHTRDERSRPERAPVRSSFPANMADAFMDYLRDELKTRGVGRDGFINIVRGLLRRQFAAAGRYDADGAFEFAERNIDIYIYRLDHPEAPYELIARNYGINNTKRLAQILKKCDFAVIDCVAPRRYPSLKKIREAVSAGAVTAENIRKELSAHIKPGHLAFFMDVISSYDAVGKIGAAKHRMSPNRAEEVGKEIMKYLRVRPDMNKIRALIDNEARGISEGLASRIHDENLKYFPDAVTGAAVGPVCIFQIIPDIIVPAGQRNMVQRLEQATARPCNGRVERIVRLECADPQEFINALKDKVDSLKKEYERNGPGGYAEFYVACPDLDAVKTILEDAQLGEKLGVKALAFAAGSQSADAAQIEGIMLALRALRKGAASLKDAYRFLTDSEPDIDSDNAAELAKRLIFTLPPARVGISELEGFNRLIEKYILDAA